MDFYLWFLLALLPITGISVFCFLHFRKKRKSKGIDNKKDKGISLDDSLQNKESSEDYFTEEDCLSEAKEIKEVKENNPEIAGRPQTLIVGYIEDITKKGLKEYIIGQAHKYFPSPHYTVYKIEKYNSGFIYEIHDGGKKVTHLKRIKKEFESGENEIILKTAGNYVKLAKNGHRIDCMILQADDEPDAKLIEEFDTAKMEEAIPLGAGTFLAGLMLLSFGIISLFLAVLFKYGLLTEDNNLENKSTLEMLPHEYLRTLPNPEPDRYVGKMILNNGGWGSEMVIKPQESVDPDVVESGYMDNPELVDGMMLPIIENNKVIETLSDDIEHRMGSGEMPSEEVIEENPFEVTEELSEYHEPFHEVNEDMLNVEGMPLENGEDRLLIEDYSPSMDAKNKLTRDNIKIETLEEIDPSVIERLPQ